MNYEQIKSHFNKCDKIKSLKDGVVREYSGFLTLTNISYDSFDEDLVLLKDGELAEVIENGVDHEGIAWDNHVSNVLKTRKRLNCSSAELLKMDYKIELRK